MHPECTARPRLTNDDVDLLLTELRRRAIRMDIMAKDASPWAGPDTVAAYRAEKERCDLLSEKIRRAAE